MATTKVRSPQRGPTPPANYKGSGGQRKHYLGITPRTPSRPQHQNQVQFRAECTGTCITLWTWDIRYKPLAEAMIRLEGHEKTYSQPSRPWKCGNPEGISTELRMGLRPTHRDEDRFEPVAFTIE